MILMYERDVETSRSLRESLQFDDTDTFERIFGVLKREDRGMLVQLLGTLGLCDRFDDDDEYPELPGVDVLSKKRVMKKELEI
jgi:hypothetical protein